MGRAGDEQVVCSPALLDSRSPVLLFDAVGTLIYAEPKPAAVYEAVGRRFGSRLSAVEVETRFRRAFAAEEKRDGQQLNGVTDEARERSRWQAIVAAVLDDVSDPAATFAALWKHFADPASWRPYDDATDVVPRLVERGYTVGVASNFDERLRPIVAAHFPQIRLEHIFASSEVGFRKPAREFFERCAAALSAKPNDCVLIGDDVGNDFHGARNAGWSSILLDRDDAHRTLAPRVGDLRAFVA